MISKEQIREFVENPDNSGLVSKKETSIPGVYVLKYKNRVFYKNLWNEVLLNCRGTLVDDDYNVIQRPFTKIFNHGENGTDISRDEYVFAVQKINGFMAAATWHNDELLVSTTGSTDSDFAKLARKWLDKEKYYDTFKEWSDYTFIFEIVDESDPHIVYENPGVYLIGTREKDWNVPNHGFGEGMLDDIANDTGWLRLTWKVARFSDIVKEAKVAKHEGFVCYTFDQKQELKIKTPFYLVTKFFGRMTDKRFRDFLENPGMAKRRIDEEYYHVIDFLVDNKDAFLKMKKQERINFVRGFIERGY